MNYEFFSNIFRALMEAESVAFNENKELLATQTEKAKVSILIQFDKFFPTKVEDIINRPRFSCRPFFEIIAEYPCLLIGRERRFLKFVASVAKYRGRNKKIALDNNVVKIMCCHQIDDFVWRQVVNEADSSYFEDAVSAVLAQIDKHRSRSGAMLVEELLPSWVQAFPNIGFNLPNLEVAEEMLREL